MNFSNSSGVGPSTCKEQLQHRKEFLAMEHLILDLSAKVAEGFLWYMFARNKTSTDTNDVPQATKKAKCQEKYITKGGWLKALQLDCSGLFLFEVEELF